MPTRHSIEVRVPIPRDLPPREVVATLQRFEPLLDNHGYVITYRPKAWVSDADQAVIKGDAFFRHDCDDDLEAAIAAAGSPWWLCDVYEDVYYVPFLVPYFSRLKRYLAVGYRTPSGIRFRQSVSGGVVTRGSFAVISRTTGLPYGWQPDTWDGDTEKGSVASASDTAAAAAADKDPLWELVCACEIEMPLILILSQILRREANRALCERLCKAVLRETVIAYDLSRPSTP
ncbi:hypothetical protein GQX73_g8426 [Xylaria multiplex]|uniref:Uncharacterized protein n=1 Tax=Xylaria multiplex TaxID=323545 RepID=A0A7C8IME6_9PEZI|nr:hypothetical protein GQX73_g8426 [Xylaria multiplex]